MGMETLYHGTTEEIETIDRDICLTDDYDTALTYIEGIPGGQVYTITLADGTELANEDEIWDAARTVYGDLEGVFGWPCTFELADDAKVRDELASRGYTGCRYDDLNINNEREHLTIRVWAAARIEGKEKVA